jgi:hypothetical protein
VRRFPTIMRSKIRGLQLQRPAHIGYLSPLEYSRIHPQSRRRSQALRSFLAKQDRAPGRAFPPGWGEVTCTTTSFLGARSEGQLHGCFLPLTLFKEFCQSYARAR